MKIRLPKTDKRVIVNEEKGAVVTILTGVDNGVNFKFVGVAKCSPEDTFNEEIGRIISYKRARIQMLMAFRSSVRREIKNIRKYMTSAKEAEDTITRKIINLKDEINNSVR